MKMPKKNRVGAPTKYGWDTFKVGESRTYKASMKTIMPAVYGYASRTGKKFSGKTQDKKVIITRKK